MQSLRHIYHLNCRLILTPFLKTMSVEVLTHSGKQAVCILSVWKPKTKPSKSMNLIQCYKQLIQSPAESVIELGHLLHIFLFSNHAISLSLKYQWQIKQKWTCEEYGEENAENKAIQSILSFLSKSLAGVLCPITALIACYAASFQHSCSQTGWLNVSSDSSYPIQMIHSWMAAGEQDSVHFRSLPYHSIHGRLQILQILLVERSRCKLENIFMWFYSSFMIDYGSTHDGEKSSSE